MREMPLLFHSSVNKRRGDGRQPESESKLIAANLIERTFDSYTFKMHLHNINNWVPWYLIIKSLCKMSPPPAQVSDYQCEVWLSLSGYLPADWGCTTSIRIWLVLSSTGYINLICLVNSEKSSMAQHSQWLWVWCYWSFCQHLKSSRSLITSLFVFLQNAAVKTSLLQS